MKAALTWCLLLLASALPALAQDDPTRLPTVSYTLLDGSHLVDDCLICGRPTIMIPMRGNFDLVTLQDTPPYTRYAVRNIDFTTDDRPFGTIHVTGSGTYTRFEEFARIQNMTLAVQIKDPYTNKVAYFTNDTPIATQPWPLIEISLTQTNGVLLQTYSLEIFAAPLREIWFSTSRNLSATNQPGVTNPISAGDLISNRGRVVRRNRDLVGRLGVMPIVPDLGLDAVHVTRRGEILFSIPHDVWSETLGRLGNGDLLSDRGAIVKRNVTLLAAFGVTAFRPDSGLDAVQLLPDGEILFSIRSNIVADAGLALGRGDILSDRGKIFRTNKQLLANFHPAVTNRDFGLDALHILPSGEIWFSVEESFGDTHLSTVLEGDLLSDRGYRVFRNSQLVAPFDPLNPNQDYGLDALYVIADTKPAYSSRFTKFHRNHVNGVVHLEWDGEGDVFQVEHSVSPYGPWLPCSPILPDVIFDDPCDLTGAASGFYRLRSW
jgi:hypothetical protein